MLAVLCAAASVPARATPEALGQLADYEEQLRNQRPAVEASGDSVPHARQAAGGATRSSRSSALSARMSEAPMARASGADRGFDRGYNWGRKPVKALIRVGDQMGAAVFFPPILILAIATMAILTFGALLAGAVTALID